MHIENIVVAVDFSEESDVAVNQAMDIARRHGAHVTLLHAGIVPETPLAVAASMQSTVNEYTKVIAEHLAEDRRRLEEMRERIAGQGTQVSHMVVDGIPDKSIIQAVAELSPDLVLLGTHGRTGIRRFLLGSVAERVVRHVERHVLIARPGDSRGGYKRVLVATDFSDNAERALEIGMSMSASDATVDLLHCWYMPPLSYPYYTPTKSGADLMTSMRQSINTSNRELGQALVDKHQCDGRTLSFHQIEATPTRGIQEWLEQHDRYDLVVTGSHGRRGASRWLLGSVAEVTVRHAPCSVLVVHAAAFDKPEKA